MISAFIANGNALHQVVELLGHVCLNFTLFLTCCFLPVTPKPLTGIVQLIYSWKAAVNTQLSRVDHFFMLVMILKVFHLKFIQHSSWTWCYFHVELLWRIFVCNFLIHSLVLHKWYSCCTNFSHNKFFNFLQRSTWTYNDNKFSLCIFIPF